MKKPLPTNDEIAGVLDQIADLLETQDANPFRVRSYRDGASTVRQADEPLAQTVQQEGTDALQRLPNIGEGLAGLIGEYVETGRSDLLDRLRGEVTPQQVFTRVRASVKSWPPASQPPWRFEPWRSWRKRLTTGCGGQKMDLQANFRSSHSPIVMV